MKPTRIALCLTGVALVAACGSPSTPSGGNNPGIKPAPNTSVGAVATYSIKNFAFPPLTVSAGQHVVVLNEDTSPHTVTADDHSFDTGSISKGKPGGFTAPTKPGTYKFHCTFHGSMHGVLTVK